MPQPLRDVFLRLITGGGGVSQLLAGAGIGLAPPGGTGIVTVTNTGVVSLVAGTSITITPLGGGAFQINGPAALPFPGAVDPLDPLAFTRLASGALVPMVPAYDTFGCPQTWICGWNPGPPTGPPGGPIGSKFRMGANNADGDGFDRDTEGAVFWQPSLDRGSRVKANRFGLCLASDATAVGYYFKVTDSSLFYRHVLALDGDTDVILHVDRATKRIGIGTDTPGPNSDLDLASGSLAYRRKALVLAALGNYDIDLVTAPRAIYYRITGPGAQFSIGGFAGGGDGRTIVIENSTAFPMTIKNEDAADLVAANRITTQTGADLVFDPAGGGSALLVYDPDSSRWIVVSAAGIPAAAPAIPVASDSVSNDLSMSSAVFVPVNHSNALPTPLSLAFAPTAPAKLDVSFSASMEQSIATGVTSVRLMLDGAPIPAALAAWQTPYNGGIGALSLRAIVPVAPGPHTVTVEWKNDGIETTLILATSQPALEAGLLCGAQLP